MCLHRFCLAVLLCVASSASHAVCYGWSPSWTTGTYGSPEEVCAQRTYSAGINHAAPLYVNDDLYQCRYEYQGTIYDDSVYANRVEVTCGATCVLSAVGSEIHNITIGWGRSPVPDAQDLVGEPYSDSSVLVNVGGCVRQLDSVARCWRSQEPSAQGLYRVSCDFGAHSTGDASPTGVVSDPALDPSTAIMSCPGYVGEVNGRAQCVGTSEASPLPAQSGGVPPKGQEVGNPAAGTKPSSGQGSGDTGVSRTPTTGNGGNDGGGSSAAIPAPGTVGSTITVNVPPIDVPTCGLPGKPKCAIDETGTPDGHGVDGAVAAVGTAGSSLIDGISNVASPSSLGWTFSLGLPVPSCSNFSFFRPGGTWVVDVCANWLVNFLRLVWAWAFAVGCAVYCWRTVTSAVGGK